MKTPPLPVTSAVRWLRAHLIPFEPFFYEYVEHGGTHRCAETFNIDEHAIIKTLVMATDMGQRLLVLMHGDREVSTKTLARLLNVKQVAPLTPAEAEKTTGYQVGGTSPFGTRLPLPVYVEASILTLPRIWINGGKRGFLIAIEPSALRSLPHFTPVHVANVG